MAESKKNDEKKIKIVTKITYFIASSHSSN